MTRAPFFEPTPDDRAMLIGRPALPAVLAIAVGVINLVRLGLAPDMWPDTYALVAGGLFAILSIIAYTDVVLGGPGRSWPKAFSAFGGLIAYGFSLLMGYLGAFTLWLAFSEQFSIGRLLFGLVWIALGYRTLYTFWITTEIGEARAKARRDVAS